MPLKLTPTDTPSSPHDPINAALYWLLGAILVFAPLFRSGRPALAVLVLELVSVSLLVLILWQPQRIILPKAQTLVLALLFAVPLLYLVPLPAGMAEWLPGRDPYLAGQALLAGAGGNSLARLSLFPLQTESAVLLLILPVAVFLGTRTLDPPRVLRLVLLLLALAALQALLGLLQYVASDGSPQLFGMELSDVRSAQGTYTNRNHLAGLLEMLLPIALALLVYTIGRESTGKGRGWKGRLTFFASTRGHTTFVYGAIAFLLLLGIVFTRSRTGISLSILALLLSTIAFARRIGGTNVYGATGTVIAFAVGVGIAIGLVPVLDRFSAADAVSDARWTIFSATLDGIGAFSPIGSGPGSYSDVFPLFQPPELGRWFISHAHNDFLEWLFEGGLFAAVLILLLLLLYARQWSRVWAGEEWSRFRFVQVAAGIGLLLMLLHSFTDFNLHIPANIAYFAFLAGVFFSESANEAAPARAKQRRTPRLADNPTASPVPLRGQSPKAMQNIDSRTLTSLDEDRRVRAGDLDQDGDGSDVARNLASVRETLARLARRIPVLLLVQSGEASEKETMVSTLRALEHRLTAYTRASEQHLDAWQVEPHAPDRQADLSSAQGEPEQEGGIRADAPRHLDDLATLQADFETLIGAVDAFADNPDSGDNLSELEARLDDTEGRLSTIIGESTLEVSAAPRTRKAPRHSSHHHQHAGESAPTANVRKPTRSNEPNLQEVPEKPQEDTTPGETQPADATQDLELAELRRRVRHLEARIKLGTALLVIASGLVVASWWLSGIFVDMNRNDSGALHPEPEVSTDRLLDADDRLLLPTSETMKQEAPADRPSDFEPAERSLAIPQIGAHLETPETGVAGLSLPTTPAAPPGHEVPAGPGEIDAGSAEPLASSGDISETSHGESGEKGTTPPPQDDRETESTESTDATDDLTRSSTTERSEALTLAHPRFGIQLIAFHDEAALLNFIRSTELGENAVYARTPPEAGNWYIVLKGFYPSADEARKAARGLSPGLKRLKPWVKRYPAGITYHRIE